MTTKKRDILLSRILFYWWPRTELNRRHEDFQSSALPAELPGQQILIKALAGLTGIEPAIFSVTGRHVNRYTTDPLFAALIYYYRNQNKLQV